MRVAGVESLHIVQEFRSTAEGNVQDPDRLSRENLEWVIWNWGFMAGYHRKTLDVANPSKQRDTHEDEVDKDPVDGPGATIWEGMIDLDALHKWEKPRTPVMTAEMFSDLVTKECADYMKLPQHQAGFDEFWSDARDRFPNLYHAAQIIRYFSLSTARCESIFSIAKSVIGLRRASLKVETIEKLLVLKTCRGA